MVESCWGGGGGEGRQGGFEDLKLARKGFDGGSVLPVFVDGKPLEF